MPTSDQARALPRMYRHAADFSIFVLVTRYCTAMALGADCWLTLESLATPRAEIALT